MYVTHITIDDDTAKATTIESWYLPELRGSPARRIKLLQLESRQVYLLEKVGSRWRIESNPAPSG